MGQVFCTSCGKPSDGGEQFCRGCGRPLPVAGPVPAQGAPGQPPPPEARPTPTPQTFTPPAGPQPYVPVATAPHTSVVVPLMVGALAVCLVATAVLAYVLFILPASPLRTQFRAAVDALPAPAEAVQGDAAQAPQLSPEQLQQGELPAGHPPAGGTMSGGSSTPSGGSMTELPAGMTPEQALKRFGQYTVEGKHAEAYKLLPMDKQQSYGTVEAYTSQVGAYGITGFNTGKPTTSGNDVTIVCEMVTPEMPVTYTWTYTKVGSAWFVESRTMGGTL